jgi:L-fuculose-phosphate aldolase
MKIEILKEIRQKVVKAGVMLAHSGMTIGTYGNISCRVDKSCIAITPSGRDYEQLSPEDIVVTDLNGEKLGGTLLPSSELPLHLEIYKSFPEARAIVHTHSTYASALAVAHKDLPPVTDELAQIVGGAVCCTDYTLAGTKELGLKAVKAMEGGRSAALLANHGAVCWGRDLKEALTTAQILEKAAEIYCLAHSLGNPFPLDNRTVETLRAFYLNHYSKRQKGEE